MNASPPRPTADSHTAAAAPNTPNSGRSHRIGLASKLVSQAPTSRTTVLVVGLDAASVRMGDVIL